MFSVLDKTKNKGFSLIEMIVVLAVMSVLIAFASLSIATINNAKVNDAAARMVTMIRQARTQSISKGQEAGKLILTVEDGKLFGQIGDDGAKELISSGMIDVFVDNYQTSNPAASAGAYTSTNISGATFTGPAEIRFLPSGVVDSATSSMPCNIRFSRGNRHWRVLLYHETGRVEAAGF